ncbi:hypothetical protein [Massilia horti]|uniref:Uncharacterized protein n=1 Tax=Massilia horti TaxID=2562153 RepID=A0A4Y9SUQ8_9BURK|nr:hypothetical protein [Massilia horti]TFW30195.1 hypothetical protein E4O92_17255 [Massilia horti]
MEKRVKIVSVTVKFALSVLGLVVLLLGYVFLKSDWDLLSDETCREIMFNNVLGRSIYPETCDKSSYLEITKKISESKEVCIFQLRPIPEKEKNCPAIEIIIDRETGEAWALDKHLRL